jgi:hypothetical protein
MAHWILVCSSGNWSGRRRKYAWQAWMNPFPFCRSPSKVGGSDGFKSFLTVQVATVGRAGVGVGWVVGREDTSQVRAVSVSPMICRVLSILASLLAIRSSSSASRESVVSGNGGNGELGEAILGGGEGASGGVKTSSLDEAD